MKKILYVFSILLVSSIIIYGTIKTYNSTESANLGSDIEDFFSYTDNTYYYNANKSEFQKNKLETSYYYRGINPIDGIYYKTTEKDPYKITKNQDKIILNIKKGEYIFVLNDIFNKYEVISENFNIKQLGKGVFYIDNSQSPIKIYTINSILDFSLMSSGKKITNFTLLPSLLFKYNTSYNNLLPNTDILRVATINDISYLDGKEENTIKTLYPKSLTDNIIKIAYDDIKYKIKRFGKNYEKALKLDYKELASYGLIQSYSDLLQNKTKKDIFYKNNIARNLVDLLKNDNYITSGNAKSAQGNDEALKIIIDSFNSISDDEILLKDAEEIVKNYYYLAYFGNVLNNNINITEKGQSSINTIIKTIFTNKISSENHYSLLSDIYFAYDFSSLTRDSLDNYINTYLKNIKDKKILKDEDFLTFSFYLSRFTFASNRITSDSVNIIIHLIEIFNNYYMIIRDADATKEKTKKFSALSVQFFNLSKIFSNINSSIIKKYFEKNEKGIYILKKEYFIDNGNSVDANVGDDFLENLNILSSFFNKDIQAKKLIFSQNLNIDNDTNTNQVKNNLSILEDKYSKLKTIIDTLNNYNSYYVKLGLDKESRDASAEIYKETYDYSKDDITSYLSTFNGVDMNTFVLINETTIDKDKFYKVKIGVSDKTLYFEIYPAEGHILKKLVIENEGVKDEKNIGQIIKLDELKTKMDEKAGGEEDPIKRQKYEFSNFFINLLFPSNNDDSSSYVNNDDNNIQESKELSLFKQQKLIEGDFTYVNKFIEIPFNQINVTIEGGKYNIILDKIAKTYNSADGSYKTEMTSMYDFANHEFNNIKLQVLNDDKTGYVFNGAEIEVVPSTITHKEFSKKMKDIGLYLDMLNSLSTSKTLDNVKFDLNLHKVFIDSEGYQISQ